MAKIVIDCADPNDLKQVEAAVGKCTVAAFNQHLGLVKAGKSTSQRDSAKLIAKDTGETPKTVLNRIQRGGQKVTQGESPTVKRSKASPKLAADPVTGGG
jgi:hypothetical protein